MVYQSFTANIILTGLDLKGFGLFAPINAFNAAACPPINYPVTNDMGINGSSLQALGLEMVPFSFPSFFYPVETLYDEQSRFDREARQSHFGHASRNTNEPESRSQEWPLFSQEDALKALLPSKSPHAVPEIGAIADAAARELGIELLSLESTVTEIRPMVSVFSERPAPPQDDYATIGPFDRPSPFSQEEALEALRLSASPDVTPGPTGTADQFNNMVSIMNQDYTGRTRINLTGLSRLRATLLHFVKDAKSEHWGQFADYMRTDLAQLFVTIRFLEQNYQEITRGRPLSEIDLNASDNAARMENLYRHMSYTIEKVNYLTSLPDYQPPQISGEVLSEIEAPTAPPIDEPTNETRPAEIQERRAADTEEQERREAEQMGIQTRRQPSRQRQVTLGFDPLYELIRLETEAVQYALRTGEPQAITIKLDNNRQRIPNDVEVWVASEADADRVRKAIRLDPETSSIEVPYFYSLQEHDILRHNEVPIRTPNDTLIMNEAGQEISITAYEAGTLVRGTHFVPVNINVINESRPKALRTSKEAAVAYKIAWNNRIFWAKSIFGQRRFAFLNKHAISVFEVHPDLEEPSGRFKDLANLVADKIHNAEAHGRIRDMILVLQTLHMQFKPKDHRRASINRAINNAKVRLDRSASSDVSLFYIWVTLSRAIALSISEENMGGMAHYPIRNLIEQEAHKSPDVVMGNYRLSTNDARLVVQK